MKRVNNEPVKYNLSKASFFPNFPFIMPRIRGKKGTNLKPLFFASYKENLLGITIFAVSLFLLQKHNCYNIFTTFFHFTHHERCYIAAKCSCVRYRFSLVCIRMTYFVTFNELLRPCFSFQLNPIILIDVINNLIIP